jgi:hypothetical protein
MTMTIYLYRRDSGERGLREEAAIKLEGGNFRLRENMIHRLQ